MSAQVHKGQVSIDFIIALSIFSFGLVILICQIPMLFAPLQTVSTDIQPVAYRTSMILAEDGGIHERSGHITSCWEDPEGNEWTYNKNRDMLSNYHGNVGRIGLAMSAPDWSSSEDIVPHNLSRNKLHALQDWWHDGGSSKSGNSSLITDKLGLHVTCNKEPLNYSYNISLNAFNGRVITNATGSPLLKIGDSIPESGVTVEKIERIVAVDNCTYFNCGRIGAVEGAKLVVCIWR